MTEKNFDLNEFSHSIYLDSSLSDVFQYIATAEGISRWFLGNAVYTKPGGKVLLPSETAQKNDTFRWQWLAKELNIQGNIIDSVDNFLFSFTFGSSFEVSITLKEHENRILLTLHQNYSHGVSKNDFAFINCCVCWVFFLTNLKSVVEYQIDLRETRADDESLVNR